MSGSGFYFKICGVLLCANAVWYELDEGMGCGGKSVYIVT